MAQMVVRVAAMFVFIAVYPASTASAEETDIPPAPTHLEPLPSSATPPTNEVGASSASPHELSFEALAGIGWGMLFEHRRPPHNSLGLGYVGQLGVEVNRFVLAARMEIYEGEEQEEWSSAASDLFLGCVFGYSFGGALVLRPQLFIGLDHQTTRQSDNSQGNVELGVLPGVAGLLYHGVLRIGLEVTTPALVTVTVANRNSPGASHKIFAGFMTHAFVGLGL